MVHYQDKLNLFFRSDLLSAMGINFVNYFSNRIISNS